LSDDECRQLSVAHKRFKQLVAKCSKADPDPIAAVQGRTEQELREAGKPEHLAAAWAHATAKGYGAPDAMYRVVLDWFDRWADDVARPKILPGGRFTKLMEL